MGRTCCQGTVLGVPCSGGPERDPVAGGAGGRAGGGVGRGRGLRGGHRYVLACEHRHLSARVQTLEMEDIVGI